MEKLYSIPEAAPLIGIAVRTVRKWIAVGKINATKPGDGRKWMIRESEIKRLRGESEDDDND